MIDISIRQRRGRSQQEAQKFVIGPLFCHKKEEKMFVGDDKWLLCRGEERRGGACKEEEEEKEGREGWRKGSECGGEGEEIRA